MFNFSPTIGHRKEHNPCTETVHTYAAIKSVCDKTNLSCVLLQLRKLLCCWSLLQNVRQIQTNNTKLSWVTTLQHVDDLDKTRLLLCYKETKAVGFCVSHVTHFYFTYVLVKRIIFPLSSNIYDDMNAFSWNLTVWIPLKCNFGVIGIRILLLCPPTTEACGLCFDQWKIRRLMLSICNTLKFESIKQQI